MLKSELEANQQCLLKSAVLSFRYPESSIQNILRISAGFSVGLKFCIKIVFSEYVISTV